MEAQKITGTERKTIGPLDLCPKRKIKKNHFGEFRSERASEASSEKSVQKT
jgi:hypothetical protein